MISFIFQKKRKIIKNLQYLWFNNKFKNKENNSKKKGIKIFN